MRPSLLPAKLLLRCDDLTCLRALVLLSVEQLLVDTAGRGLQTVLHHPPPIPADFP